MIENISATGSDQNHFICVFPMNISRFDLYFVMIRVNIIRLFSNRKKPRALVKVDYYSSQRTLNP